MQVIKSPINSVFLVDDDEDDCLVFKLALQELNPAIELTYENACETALAALAAKTPDLIFLDINLPRISGLEILQQLQADAEQRKIPVVMYSSSELPKDLMTSYLSGATLYLRKPSDLKTLIDSLRNILAMAWHQPDVIKSQYYKDGQFFPYVDVQ